jgi:hypothetical protein
MRPTREHATSNGQTYMVTSSTWGRRALFSREVWANLLIDTLYHYRGSKPTSLTAHDTARLEGAPFQSNVGADARSDQDQKPMSTAEAVCDWGVYNAR